MKSIKIFLIFKILAVLTWLPSYAQLDCSHDFAKLVSTYYSSNGATEMDVMNLICKQDGRNRIIPVDSMQIDYLYDLNSFYQRTGSEEIVSVDSFMIYIMNHDKGIIVSQTASFNNLVIRLDEIFKEINYLKCQVKTQKGNKRVLSLNFQSSKSFLEYDSLLIHYNGTTSIIESMHVYYKRGIWNEIGIDRGVLVIRILHQKFNIKNDPRLKSKSYISKIGEDILLKGKYSKYELLN